MAAVLPLLRDDPHRWLRQRSRAAVGSLFVAPDPLAATMAWPGDEGMCGPGSVSWRVVGDVSAFVGGIRALLVQACHPEVLAGVVQHSRYRDDPLGRLGRTSAYVTATTFGATAEAEAALAAVRRAHGAVAGVSSRGLPYRAGEPELAAWVHNSLTESFLVAYRHFGPAGRPLSAAEEDRFVAEQAAIGARLGAAPLPQGVKELQCWLEEHPAAARCPDLDEVVAFLERPPLPLPARVPYRLLFSGAVAVLGPRWQELLGLAARPGDRVGAEAVVGSLRLLLGAEGPSLEAARARCAAA